MGFDGRNLEVCQLEDSSVLLHKRVAPFVSDGLGRVIARGLAV